jgi:hypothetical protein
MSRRRRHQAQRHKAPVASESEAVPPRKRAEDVSRWALAGWVVLRRSWPELLFFLAYLAYVRFEIDPSLQYQRQSPLWYLDWTFFLGFFPAAGGLLEYAAAFLGQFYWHAWFGAALTLVLTWALCHLTRRVLESFLFLRELAGGQEPEPSGRTAVQHRPNPWAAMEVSVRGGLGSRGAGRAIFSMHLIPAVALVLAQSDYTFPIVRTLLGLLCSVGLTLQYLGMLRRPVAWRGALFPLVVVVLYGFGQGFYLLFVALSLMAELMLTKWRGWPMWLWGGAVSALVPLCWPGLHAGGDAQRYAGLLPIEPFAPSLGLMVFYPLASALLAVASQQAVWSATRRSAPARPRPERRLRARRQALEFLGRHAPVGLGLIAAGCLWVTADPQRKLLVAIDALARRRQWADVMTCATRLRTATPSAGIDIHLALYHLGRLPSDQFSRALPEGLILLPVTNEQLRAAGLSFVDVLLELGHVNHAEHWAYESLELQGEQPLLLQRLALIHYLKGQPEAARVHLNLLRKNPVFRSRADRMLRSPAVTLPELPCLEPATYHALMVNKDYPSSYVQIDSLLLQLLRTNLRNRMAFEYLMAHYLQTRQLDKAVQLLNQLRHYSYPETPLPYEEALVLFRAVSGQSSAEPPDLVIRRGLEDRLRDFTAAYRSAQGQRDVARQGLESKWGSTYWFYYFLADAGAASPLPDAEEYH